MGLCLAMPTADGSERVFRLAAGRTVLGRDSRCGLRVSLPQVAPYHCAVVTDNGEVRVEDLDSETGTFHNGSRVETAELTANDRVTIGSVTFVVRTDRPLGARDTIAELKPRPTKETQPKAASEGSFSSET